MHTYSKSVLKIDADDWAIVECLCDEVNAVLDVYRTYYGEDEAVTTTFKHYYMIMNNAIISDAAKEGFAEAFIASTKDWVLP